MSSNRRAALCLHGLQQVDQEWLLNKLQSSHRDSMQKLLGELTDLGIPKKNIWSSERENSFSQGALKNEIQALTCFDNVNQATALNVLSVLENESTTIVSSIVNAYSWRWQKQVVNYYGGQGNTLINKVNVESDCQINMKVMKSLLTIFSVRLREMPVNTEIGNQLMCEPAQPALIISKKKRFRLWRK